VGDVVGVTQIGARPRREVALEQVPADICGRDGDGGGAPPLLPAAFRPGGAHQPGDSPFPAAGVLAAQGPADRDHFRHRRTCPWP
jgi:hypothetical protein